LTCSGPNEDNCLSCEERKFYEVENYKNRCLKFEEIPKNYYSIDYLSPYKYYKCHKDCKTCYKGYNQKKNKTYCNECVEGKYFSDIEFTNCIKKEDGFYIGIYKKKEVMFNIRLDCIYKL
jgi:hypothetical protein